MKDNSRLIILISIGFTLLIFIIVFSRINNNRKLEQKIAMYSGSESCKPCHERFYELWAPSHHGLAMQEVSPGFIDTEIRNLTEGIAVGESLFSVEVSDSSLFFVQLEPGGELKRYKAVHALGGKYIYYFLTEFDRGRLHTLPLAYDCKTESWYNNPESGVRHFETIEDEALDWENHLYTFNTSCYSCHVSQLESNFNLEDLTYTTTWSEPGINCETCHGPSSEHIRVCVEAGEGEVPDDLKIILTSAYTPEQNDAACGSCHAKSGIVAPGYPPGERFYDYFNLITLENHDFYADGRDLGENYTMTTWSLNTCQMESDMHCVSCHTSSGRYRFSGENPNLACSPCHSDKVDNVSAHSHHKPESTGSECIACHMPKTVFARMDRSDHSFRPPMPKASMAFGSPNACNLCHHDQSAEWSQAWIEKTHGHNLGYQDETLRLGSYIRELRDENWNSLDKLNMGLVAGEFGEVYTTSYIRLLESCNEQSKWEGIMARKDDESPLVRSAVASALATNGSEEALDILMKLVNDDYRLVRINAANALSMYGNRYPGILNDTAVTEALNEYISSLTSRPDDWSSHYNLGNFYSAGADYQKALEAYQNSIKVYPEAIMPMVNAGYLYSLTGNMEASEKMFEMALSVEPDHEAALLNLALLYGETGNNERAISCFRRLLLVSDKNATAAYNLGILLNESDPIESLALLKNASAWDKNPKYSYTYAYFLGKEGNTPKAKTVLKGLLELNPGYTDAYFLMGTLMIEQGNGKEARKFLNEALLKDFFTDEQKQGIQALLKSIVE
ncbi:MAG: tetratricopeptide repeat protein [Marinilabiliaceae bacterium]|jgi:tetratricopeptide (TPR) repeat protein|nr:tetratricopeptide repeat protein [Marinilabiliaceae bacterium]